MDALQSLAQPSLELLSDLHGFWRGLPFTWVLAAHCCFCASMAPEFKDRFMVHYMLTLLWGFGGGIITAYLIMDPSKAPLAFLVNNQVGITWTVCWWLLNYAPGGYLEQLHSLWFVKMFTKGGTSLMRAQLIIARVDLAVSLYPGVIAAPLLLGTVAGCGGRLLADAIKVSWGVPAHTAELTSPGWVSRSALMAAALYYVSVYWLGLPATAMAGLLVTLKMVHSFAADIAGHSLDVTAPIADILHTLSNVPNPSPLQRAKASKPAGPKSTPVKPAGAANGATSAASVPAGSESGAVRRSTRSRVRQAAD